MWILATEIERGGGRGGGRFPRQDAHCPLSNRTLSPQTSGHHCHYGEVPHVSLPVSQTPLLAPSLLPVASPRLLSREAWVSPERVCPWGKPLGSVPCSSADIPAEGRGVRCPPHARVLAQAGGSASAEESRKRAGEARQNRGPVPGTQAASEELQLPTGS